MADEQGSERPRAYAAVRDWSKQEKFDLLQGLKQFCSRDIDNIAKMIPSKTTEQIRNAIEYYREIATAVRVAPELPVRKCKRTATKNYRPVPLCSWAKLLQDSFDFKQLETTTADSIRIIAECENIPPAKYTNFIDFRKIYHAIADAMEGKPLPEDPIMACVLEKCMLEAALHSKKFNENFLEELDLSGSPEQLPQPTDSQELACLKLLASQKAYNPLNVPVEYLKPEPSSSDVSSDSDEESGGSLDTD